MKDLWLEYELKAQMKKLSYELGLLIERVEKIERQLHAQTC